MLITISLTFCNINFNLFLKKVKFSLPKRNYYFLFELKIEINLNIYSI